MGSLLRTTARVPFSRTFSSTSLRLNTAAASATDGEQMIRTILTDRFQPSVLKVQDVSGEWPPVPSSRPESCSEYADGERGARIGGCGSFYAIQLSSKKFNGLSTVKAHRLVNEQLKDVIKDIHGLQVRSSLNPNFHSFPALIPCLSLGCPNSSGQCPRNNPLALRTTHKS